MLVATPAIARSCRARGRTAAKSLDSFQPGHFDVYRIANSQAAQPPQILDALHVSGSQIGS